MAESSEMSVEVGECCPIHNHSLTIRGGESRLDPAVWSDPFPFYRALREQAPVHYDPKLDVYLISRYDDIMAILRDDVTYSVEHGYQDRWGNGFVAELTEIMERDGGGFIRDPVYDPPLHKRYRKLVEKAFSAHRVKSLEPRIRQIVVDILEPLIVKGYADGRRDIGIPLTARIMCEQLGFNFVELGAERISRWAAAVVAQMGRRQTHEEMLENAREICDLQNYIIRQIRDREVHPREDMTSDLVHATLPDEENPKLTFQEQIAWIRALLIGGSDSTSTALTNLLMMLASDPELARKLHEAADDERLLSRFVEEVLRTKPPTHGLFRTVTRDTEIGGVKIPAEAQVHILFASANDDPNKFSCPREIRTDRDNLSSMLTFGAGIHKCVGASLARMEVRVAAHEIIKRMVDIKLEVEIDQLEHLPMLAAHTVDRLPLSFKRRI